MRCVPKARELITSETLITTGSGKTGQAYFSSLKVLGTVIYLAIMLTSSICRKLGVIIRLSEN